MQQRSRPVTRTSGAALLAVVAATALSAEPAPTDVVVRQPVRGEIIRYVKLPATVRASEEVTLYAQVAGSLRSIKVDKGDAVKAGALLAEIQAPELIADLARYQAETAVAKTEYERLEQAQRNAPDLVMPIESERARGKYEVAKANLERVQTLLSFTRITAPFSGTITARYVDLGAFIPAGTSGSVAQNAGIVTLMNFNTVRVQVAIPEMEAWRVSKGQPVRLSVEGLGERKYEGTVTRYAYALDTRSQAMLAEIDIPNPQRELRPGMYATVQIGLERKPDALLIPVDALLMEKTNAFVFVSDGGRAKKTAIKIGFNDGANVEVVEGLTASTPVILIRNRPLSDGQVVQIAQVGKTGVGGT